MKSVALITGYVLVMLFIIIALTGCATTQNLDIPKIQAPIEIMQDCEEFIIPQDSSLKSFAKALYDNKKVYLLCNSQNKSKKEFILNISR